MKMYKEAETTTGRILGIDTGPVLAFKGIPYAAPTGGANRFRAPKPVAPWRGVRDCIGHGFASPQAPVDPRQDFANLLQFNLAASIGGMGEDCANLNIWTPALRDGAKRPVLVSFHGGGFNNGSGNLPLYEGGHLAADGDVVVVTVNHRLNAFGYLDFTSAGAPQSFGDGGVAGLLDLVAALEWVRDNAEAFGGDPSRVTIFGQSGGGWKTSCLLAMPAARGLFHRAMIQSGSRLRVQSKEDGARLAAAVLAKLELPANRADRLREMPWTTFHRAAAEVGLPLFEPVLHDKHLPRHPFDPDAPPEAQGVPIIIGTTQDDASFIYPEPDLGEEPMRAMVRKRFGSNGEALLASYRRALPDLTPFLLMGRIVTDAGFRRFAHAQAERIAAAGRTPLYVYQWNWTTPAFGGVYGAAHAGDVPATFYNTEHALLGGGSATGVELAGRFSRAVLNFAGTGEPGDEQAPWPTFDVQKRATKVFDQTSKVVEDPDGELRRLWKSIPIPATVFG